MADDTPTYNLKDWDKLTVKQRRSRKALYNYLKSVLDGEDSSGNQFEELE